MSTAVLKYHPADALGKQDLIRRRPIVNAVGLWMGLVSVGGARLDVSSTQLVSRIARQIWKVLDSLRETDITQPVGQQIILAQQTAGARMMTLLYGINAPHATGSFRVSISDGGNRALQSLEAFDPALQGAATFDLVATLQTVLKNTRFMA